MPLRFGAYYILGYSAAPAACGVRVAWKRATQILVCHPLLVNKDCGGQREAGLLNMCCSLIGPLDGKS
jgi:hypothetical protein